MNPNPVTTASPRDWNALVRAAPGGTVFHDLDFLAYHDDRFIDHACHLAWRDEDEVCAVLPLGVFGDEARSPFGASFGGWICRTRPSMRRALAMVGGFIDWLRDAGLRRCRVTLPPPCYDVEADETFAFALAAHGFRVERRELTYVVALGEASTSNWCPAARRQARKARRLGVEVRRDVEPRVLYPLLASEKRRLGRRPTHSLAELERIAAAGRFVRCDVAVHEGEIVAGNMYFLCNSAWFSFYPCVRRGGTNLGAGNLLFAEAMADARAAGCRAMDLGTTSVDQRVENPELCRFKESIGGRPALRDTWLWTRPQ